QPRRRRPRLGHEPGCPAAGRPPPTGPANTRPPPPAGTPAPQHQTPTPPDPDPAAPNPPTATASTSPDSERARREGGGHLGRLAGRSVTRVIVVWIAVGLEKGDHFVPGPKDLTLTQNDRCRESFSSHQPPRG